MSCSAPAAGLLGTLVMNHVTTWLYDRESRGVRARGATLVAESRRMSSPPNVAPRRWARASTSSIFNALGNIGKETDVKARITMLTIGVDDLERALAFYREGLGLPSAGVIGTEFEHGAVAFVDLEGGLKLALWPRASIAHDVGMAVTPRSATEFTIAHNVRTRAEVDTVLAQATQAGARIVKTAADTFYGGYAGYFEDPDGHLWEVAWNPQLLPPD
jgi:catechol 2,3-dioxygenase-like lactoylglutathione lyase family enzyme